MNNTTMAPFNITNGSIICYTPTMATTNGLWQGDNPLDYALPLFILQLTLVVCATRFFVFILKPFNQPRVIAEILGGLLLGPSVMGRNKKFANTIFPLKSVMVMETTANIGLIYFLFLVGLEMDVSIIKRAGKKSVSIALAGMVLPFLAGVCASTLVVDTNQNMNQASYFLYLGIVLSVTAFPVLARLLAELKLINTELGKLALSTALVNDVCAWMLLTLAIALSEQKTSSWASLWVLLSNLVFVSFCFIVVRPAVKWLIERTPEGKPFSESQICIVLVGVLVSAFITDMLGTHSVFGAFVYGLVIPNGPLGAAIIEKLEDFVSGLLLPLFYAISGLKTDIRLISTSNSLIFLLVIPVACLGKVVGTLLVSLAFQIPHRDGVVLGLLTNTKGIVEMIVLNVGREQKVLGDKIFSIMVIVTLIMAAIISPIVTLIHKPRKRLAPYKKRTMQSSRLNSELRVLVCIHTPRNVPTIINLLEATHPHKSSPISAHVLHLVELTGRASAMLIVHANRESGGPALNKTQAQTDHIITAFQNFEENVGHTSVQPLTAISPYSTMHEDICNLAEDKRVSIIIIPFHKQQTVDGEMLDTVPEFRMVNHNLLQNSPCSIGILVDRGLNGSNRLIGSQASHQVVVLYFGGPDDRDALAYGWRMSRHPRVHLTVMHFIPSKDATQTPEDLSWAPIDESFTTTMGDMENKLDEDYINDFKSVIINDDSVVYMDKVVNNGEETIAAIRSMNHINDLFIVGRGQGTMSSLTDGLTDWSECPELGPIGDLLASSDFETTASVLVMHQYVEQGPDGEEFFVTSKPWQTSENYQNMKQQQQQQQQQQHNQRYTMPVEMGYSHL